MSRRGAKMSLVGLGDLVPVFHSFGFRASRRVLGGSWVVISGVISKVTIAITHILGTYNHTYN